MIPNDRYALKSVSVIFFSFLLKLSYIYIIVYASDTLGQYADLIFKKEIYLFSTLFCCKSFSVKGLRKIWGRAHIGLFPYMRFPICNSIACATDGQEPLAAFPLGLPSPIGMDYTFELSR